MKAAGMNKKGESKNYKGFVAGVFSGIAKLTGEFAHPASFQLRAIVEYSILARVIANDTMQHNSRPPLRHHKSPPPNLTPISIQRSTPMPPHHRAKRIHNRPLQRRHPTARRLDVHGLNHARLPNLLPQIPLRDPFFNSPPQRVPEFLRT